jgi:hypothetical protein
LSRHAGPEACLPPIVTTKTGMVAPVDGYVLRSFTGDVRHRFTEARLGTRVVAIAGQAIGCCRITAMLY